jgi:hypothetical protein
VRLRGFRVSSSSRCSLVLTVRISCDPIKHSHMKNARTRSHNAPRSRLALSLAAPLLAAFAIALPADALPFLASPTSRVESIRRTAALVRADTGETAQLAGTVYDSVTNAPLAGAEVQLVDLDNRARAYTVRADSLGRFRVDSMRPGRYAAGFFHPSLDALGIEPPLRSAIVHKGSDNYLGLAIPGPVTIMNAVCGVRPAKDSVGAMAGIVRDADSGFPIAGARVVVSWLEIVIDKRGLASGQRRVPVKTGDDGSYRICGLPGADTVLGNADAPGRRSGVVGVPIPLGGLVRRDFTLGDSVSAVALVPDSAASADVRLETTLLRGSARLSGMARGPDRKPIQGAKIVVWGTGLEATTRADGSFSLSGLPAGTFSVEARMLGFEPKRVAVDLSTKIPASVDITFKERVPELSRVVIMGKPSRIGLNLDDFLRRSRTGMGHYITAADNSLKNAYAVSDALRMTPGVRVVPSGSFGHVILLRGQCAPVVYLDGVQATDGYKTLDDIVPPQQVAGIEVYAGLGEAPPQYQSNGCGVILVWTKR